MEVHRFAELRSNAIVVAQVWRDQHGRQANLARLLHAVDVRAISQQDGRSAGALLAAAGTADPIDATVVLLAAPGPADAQPYTELDEWCTWRGSVAGGPDSHRAGVGSECVDRY